MAQYQILYWKHVPAQVRVFDTGKRRISRSMPARFQVEIDKIAMDEGLAGSEEYLNQWRWTPTMERPGAGEELADALVRELEQQFDQKST